MSVRRPVRGPRPPAPLPPLPTLGERSIFAVVYVTLVASLYVALGAVAERALGLTPLVLLVAAVLFVVTAMTYIEGASLHQERGGSQVFARYAFNELVSFVAGWAVLLDYLLLLAVVALAAATYAGVLGGPLDEPAVRTALAVAIVVAVAVEAVRGGGAAAGRFRTLFAVVALDLVLQVALIVLGVVFLLEGDVVADAVDLGSAPPLTDVVFAATLASVAFAGLESSSGLAGDVDIRRPGLRRLAVMLSLTAIVAYVAVSLIALSAVPAAAMGPEGGADAPLLPVAAAFEAEGLGGAPEVVVGVVAALTLTAAASSAMLGLSRLGYSLATNRQIPSLVGRLHPRRGTPVVVIVLGALIAVGLVLPGDLDLLVGTYAFGAMLAFSIAHLSVLVLRFREPDRPRPYAVPLGVRVGRATVPVPAVVGAVLAIAGWLSVLALHEGARTAGLIWMAAGLTLYLAYRLTEDKSLTRRVTIPEAALRREVAETDYGSILVPVFGTDLDIDIVQTAGRLAVDELRREGVETVEGTPEIEAVWVFEIPLSLPIDAPLPEAALRRAREALARAKEVGEEYEHVTVRTSTHRARRAGRGIVDAARRFGVDLIVLAAEPPSRVRGGSLLGGAGTPSVVGEVTEYVLEKAPVRVVLTAAPADETDAGNGARGGGAGA